jgi:hypothetical protein
MISRKWHSSALLALWLAGCGAGPNLLPVTGTVTLNGKPLEGATVTFYPDDGNSVKTTGHDTTGPEGNYKLSSGERFGVAAGKYKVIISKLAAKPGVTIPDEFKKDPVMAKMAGLTKESLPPSVSDAAEGTYTREVKQGAENVFEFDVKASAKTTK